MYKTGIVAFENEKPSSTGKFPSQQKILAHDFFKFFGF